MAKNRLLLLDVLKDPFGVKALSLPQWDLLIRQARTAGLAARLEKAIGDDGLLSSVPPKPQAHLRSAEIAASAQVRTVRWELVCLGRELEEVGGPIVLLKGAAYVAGGLPFAGTRFFDDIDILVPKTALDEVEDALERNGWESSHTSYYDQRYYRQWMHELPPFRHLRRQTVLDVHHRILPETARLQPSPQPMLESATSHSVLNGWRILDPQDMILHSAAHLFCDSEMDHGLRDLFDIYDLINHFLVEPEDWDQLVERALELDLGRPLFYAFQCLERVLGVEIPPTAYTRFASTAPFPPISWVMAALFERGLRPNHPTTRARGTRLARWLLFIRGHFLRMPLHLLIPHLVRKAFRGSVQKP